MPVEEDEMGEHRTVRRGFSNLEEVLDRCGRSTFALRVELYDVKGWRGRRVTFLSSRLF